MTMLEIFESKLPDGAMVLFSEGLPNRYVANVSDGESMVTVKIPKRCELDKADALAECLVAGAMMELALKRGDVDEARKWLR